MESQQTPDSQPGNYYVSVRDAGRLGLLLGPFKTHADALEYVEIAREMAIEQNPWAHFYSFGTVRMADDYTKPGILNDWCLV